MCLLEKDTNFCLGWAPDYTKDYSFYVAMYSTNIGMVMVQVDEHEQEHVIYYLSKSLLDSETHYSHVEKLSLDTVIVVHKFRQSDPHNYRVCIF